MINYSMSGHKPLWAAFFVQFLYATYYMLSKLAFDAGMNTFVFIFYRQAFATLALTPIAIFLERKTGPPSSFFIFIKIFALSLVGIAISTNILCVALKYTSAPLGAATSNILPVITFFLSVLLRMEKVNIKTSPGILKVVGLLLCMGGIAIIAFYRGPLLKILVHHHLINISLQEGQQIPPSNTWIKGVFLMLLANSFWASWLVLQGPVLRSYPSKLLLTTLQCFLSTIQSFLIAIAFTRDLDDWKLGWNIRLLSTVYCGVVVTCVTFYLQAWVIEKKGPVFLAMTNPLVLVFTIILSTFLLGEIISLGSVLGAIVLVGGLYSVLWAKAKEDGREKFGNANQPVGEDAEKEDACREG